MFHFHFMVGNVQHEKNVNSFFFMSSSIFFAHVPGEALRELL